MSYCFLRLILTNLRCLKYSGSRCARVQNCTIALDYRINLKNHFMKKTITLLLLCISSVTFAQKKVIDSVISHHIKVLKVNQVSTFFILEHYCVGCIKLHKSKQKDCDYGTSKIYLFWKENGVSYFRKLDRCDSPKIKITNELFNNFAVTMRSIKVEKVKSYQTSESGLTSIDHSTFSQFYFILDGKIETNRFDYFDISTDDMKSNINYQYNNSLAIVKLDLACQEVIKKYK